MAGRAQIRTNNSALIAMIAGEDTVTVFLLAGVGNVDLRRKTNYLIVDSSLSSLSGIIVGDFISSVQVASMMRFLVDSYNKPIPAILVPSSNHPYEPADDSVLSRVKYLFSTESVASERR